MRKFLTSITINTVTVDVPAGAVLTPPLGGSGGSTKAEVSRGSSH